MGTSALALISLLQVCRYNFRVFAENRVGLRLRAEVWEDVKGYACSLVQGFSSYTEASVRPWEGMAWSGAEGAFPVFCQDIGPDGGARGEAREHPGVAQHRPRHSYWYRLYRFCRHPRRLTGALAFLDASCSSLESMESGADVEPHPQTESWQPAFCLGGGCWPCTCQGTQQEFGR